MTTIANYYRQLQESMKLRVKGDSPRNIKSRLIHAFGDKLSFFQTSSRAGEIVYYDMDYREKVFAFGEEKIKEVGKLIKSKIEELPIKTSWPPNPDDLRQEVQVPSKNTYQRKEIFFGFFFDDRKHKTQIMKNRHFWMDGALP